MLLGFLHKCKPTRHIQRRTPFNLLLVLKFQSTRTTQGINYLIIIFNVFIYYHINLFLASIFLHFTSNSQTNCYCSVQNLILQLCLSSMYIQKIFEVPLKRPNELCKSECDLEQTSGLKKFYFLRSLICLRQQGTKKFEKYTYY